MNHTITILTSLLLLCSPLYAFECEFAYQNATYGFQHAQTAMEANNYDHLRLAAERSKTAIEKTLLSTEKCGCDDANNSSYEAIENLNKALDQDKFESMRFYVNKARTHSKNILIALDVCNANDPTHDLKVNEERLRAQKQQLLEQQKELLEQQKRLEDQMEEQIRLQVQVRLKKEIMLDSQKKLRLEAETTLKELEVLINNFTTSMGCKVTKPLTAEPYQRSLQDIELESLISTKGFYADKAREMANNLLNRLSSCEWKD